jgi:hypothetical protein
MKVELDSFLNSLGDNKIAKCGHEYTLHQLDKLTDALEQVIESSRWSSENISHKPTDLNWVISELLKIRCSVTIPRMVFSRTGNEAELLDPNSTNWIKGKLRAKIVIEFIPDENKSPLDEIRRELKTNQ